MDINHITDRMNHAEKKELLRDAILARAGVRPHRLHPSAAGIAEEDVSLLSVLAQVCGEIENRGRPAGSSIVGLTTSDFAIELSGLLTSLAMPGLQANTWHRKICDMRTVPNYNPHEFAQTLLYPEMPLILEGGEPKGMLIAGETGSVSKRLHDYGTDLFVSRATITNDDVSLMARMAKDIGAAATRRESQAIFQLLESNPSLGDSAPMFSVEAGNLYEQILTDYNLGVAMGLLRSTPLVGDEKADLTAKFLVVSPELEYEASKLVHDAGLAIEVGSSAWLPATRWYVFGDPLAAPVITLFHLPGAADKVGFSKTGGKRNQESNTFTSYFPRDGVALGARFSFGVAQTGRFAIRGGN